MSSGVGLGFEFGVAIKILLRLFFFVNLVSLTIFYNAIDLKKNSMKNEIIHIKKIVEAS